MMQMWGAEAVHSTSSAGTHRGDPEYTDIAEPLRLCPQGSPDLPSGGRGPRALFSARSQEGARDAAFYSDHLFTVYFIRTPSFLKDLFNVGHFSKSSLNWLLLLFYVFGLLAMRPVGS